MFSLDHDDVGSNIILYVQFDCEGNVPLHMAAASANLEMINMLGKRFPSGASVRNEDGMLVSENNAPSKLLPASIAHSSHPLLVV
jgi:ankyrin repeat protein